MQRKQLKSDNRKIAAGTVITLTGAGLWGLNAVVSKYLMARGLDTMWVVNFRMIMSGIALLIAAAFRDPHGMFDIFKDRRSVLRLLIIAIFAFGICQTTYYLSIDHSNAGIASAIQQTAPVYVLIAVIIKEHRLPAKAELLTLPLVILGSFLIATHGDPHALAIDPLALLFGLISALTCALYMVLPAELIRKYGTLETVGWGTLPRRMLYSPVLQTVGLSAKLGRDIDRRYGIHHTAGRGHSLCDVFIRNKYRRAGKRRCIQSV